MMELYVFIQEDGSKNKNKMKFQYYQLKKLSRRSYETFTSKIEDALSNENTS